MDEEEEVHREMRGRSRREERVQAIDDA